MMIAVAGMILFFVSVIVMCTVGAVLLVRFWAGNLGRGARIFLAAVLGPSIPVLSLLLVGASEQGPDMAVFLGVAVVMGLPIALLGIPVSLLATRKLDRMLDNAVRSSAGVFE